jgi:hypothetical protein
MLRGSRLYFLVAYRSSIALSDIIVADAEANLISPSPKIAPRAASSHGRSATRKWRL